MSFVIAAPEALDSAATDLVVLGSTLGAATAAAAAQTTGIVKQSRNRSPPHRQSRKPTVIRLHRPRR